MDDDLSLISRGDLALLCRELHKDTPTPARLTAGLTALCALPPPGRGREREALWMACGEAMAKMFATLPGDEWRLANLTANALGTLAMASTASVSICSGPQGGPVLRRLCAMLGSGNAYSQADACFSLGWLVPACSHPQLEMLVDGQLGTVADLFQGASLPQKKKKKKQQRWTKASREDGHEKERLANLRIFSLVLLAKMTHRHPRAVLRPSMRQLVPLLVQAIAGGKGKDKDGARRGVEEEDADGTDGSSAQLALQIVAVMARFVAAGRAGVAGSTVTLQKTRAAGEKEEKQEQEENDAAADKNESESVSALREVLFETRALRAVLLHKRALEQADHWDDGDDAGKRRRGGGGAVDAAFTSGEHGDGDDDSSSSSGLKRLYHHHQQQLLLASEAAQCLLIAHGRRG